MTTKITTWTCPKCGDQKRHEEYKTKEWGVVCKTPQETYDGHYCNKCFNKELPRMLFENVPLYKKTVSE